MPRRRQRRDHKRGPTSQRGQKQWLVPLVLSAALFSAFAIFVDWVLYREAINHRAQYGHIHLSHNLLALAIPLTAIALSALSYCLVQLYKSRRR